MSAKKDQAQAWLLDIGVSARAAIADRELLELVHGPEFFHVPATPTHCSRAYRWHDRLIPVWSVGAWILERDQPLDNPVAAVVRAWDRRTGTIEIGAIELAAAPQRMTVTERASAMLPSPDERWRSIALAAFDRDGRRVVVLDLWAMFGRAAVMPAAIAHGSARETEREPA